MPDTSSIFYQIGQSTKSAIAVEETRALAAEATLQTNITAEASSRASADTTLQSNIDSEASSRASADTTLQGNIDTEASSRASADSAIQSELDATQSGAGLAAGGSYSANASTNYLTSVGSLVAADEALDTQAKANADAISSEASTRASADTTLQSNIDSEASSRASADTTLQGNIDSEETARQAADSTLQTNISDEATARASADTTLQGNIDAEETARIAAVSGEATARASADTTLQSNIDSEASTRASAVSNLDTIKANLSGASFTGDVSGTNLVLSGNLTVQGTTTSLETTNSQVKDAIMLLNDGAGSSANNGNDAGFIIERGSSDDGNIAAVYDEGEDKFAFYKTSASATSTDISDDDGSATLIDVKANDVVLGDGNNLGSLADFTAAMA
jgi:cytoskeletal protein CcmA (bactofilin family)